MKNALLVQEILIVFYWSKIGTKKFSSETELEIHWNYMPIQPICSQCTLSLPPENIRKPLGFLMFSRGRERVHWEQMG